MVKQSRLVSTLALFASFFALSVISLGVFTRLIDAGLGCPDWPGCYGQLVVSAISPNPHLVAYKAWAEMIHRYFAGSLGLLMTAIFILLFQKENRRVSNRILALCLLLLLSYQILLGRFTVTLKLLPIIVTQHLLGGFLILSVLWIIYLNNKPFVLSKADGVLTKKLVPWAFLGLVILFLQISLGAWTSTNYASLSCPDFPFCVNDQPMMTMYFKKAFTLFSPIGINYEGGVLPVVIRQTIQMMHRLSALTFTLYILVFSYFAMPKLKHSPRLIKLFYLILGLLTVQLCLGISNVIFKLPLATAVSHTLVASILLLSVITFVFNLIKVSYR